MKFIRFLGDRKLSILLFALLMTFISLVIHLDGTIKVNIGNIFYINLVAYSFFMMYLVAKYLYFKNYYRSLCKIITNEGEEIINRLPKAKTYEQELFHEVLTKLYMELDSKIQSLNDQKRDHEEFITSWVHQVKTPIAVSRLLIESKSSSAASETLSSLEEELDKIENYIELALYHSKIDDFSKDYLIHEVELDKVVKGAVKKQVKTFISKKISVEIHNTNLMITTDKKWLGFILDQILSNALKYTSIGGKIKIYGLVEPKVQKLVIEDSGIGIKPEDLDRVFDKGFTGYNGRENYKSTGMGLYLCKKLARKLGHDIYIESQYGEYTKVIIVFPKLSDYLQVLN